MTPNPWLSLHFVKYQKKVHVLAKRFKGLGGSVGQLSRSQLSRAGVTPWCRSGIARFRRRMDRLPETIMYRMPSRPLCLCHTPGGLPTDLRPRHLGAVHHGLLRPHDVVRNAGMETIRARTLSSPCAGSGKASRHWCHLVPLQERCVGVVHSPCV